MLIYIHVPFCATRCTYCAFHSQALGKGIQAGSSAPIQQWLDNLFLEIAHYGDKYKGAPVQSVFFGGGTPSLLPANAIGAIMNRLGKAFNMGPKVEVTLEANPESLTRNRNPADYLAAGINRLSIGIQSLDDNILKMLGRSHKAQDSLHSLFLARQAGFGNIGVDLMWGLPGQSVRQWLQTLKDVVRLGPDHISAYGLTLEPGTSLERDCEAGNLVLPPERDQSIMFMEGSAYLEAQGFIQYEISNFGRMGFQCRHNLGYWEGSDYLGLGPSATSTIAQKRWTNPASLTAWTELVNKNDFGRDPELLTNKTRVLELIMLRLRTARGLRLKAYKEMTGRDFLRDNQKLCQTLHENGLIRIRNGYLNLTRSGMLVSNSVIGNIFERVSENLEQKSLPVLENQPLLTSLDTDNQPQPVIWPGMNKSKK